MVTRLGDTKHCFICGEVENPDTVLVELRVHPPELPDYRTAVLMRVCARCMGDLTKMWEELSIRIMVERANDIACLEEMLKE